MKKKAPKGWIKISEFEKLTGLNSKTIAAAIKRGAIPASCADRIGVSATSPYYLHPQKSAVSWYKNLSSTHPTTQSVRIALVKFIKNFDKSAVEVTPIKEKKSKGKPTLSLADAQLKEQIAKAELRELELKEKEGLLVIKAHIDDQLFEASQELRNALLAIPDRITDQIISDANNRNKVHNVIYNAIAQELEKLADMQADVSK